MKNFTKKIIGALCTLFVINSAQAQNELDIIGNWTVDSVDASVTMPLSQEALDNLATIIDLVELGVTSAEEFMNEFGFPPPSSDEEWDAITTNGITIPISDAESEIDITEFSFTETLIGITSEEGTTPLNYTWYSDSIIYIESFDEFPFTEFTIVSVNNDYITLSTSMTMIEEEDGEEIELTYNAIFYCSNKYLNINDISTLDSSNSLVKVIDILGREHKEHDKGMVLFYIYENGKVIKKINAE